MKLVYLLISFFLLLQSAGCGRLETKDVAFDPRSDAVVNDYWFSGTAELTNYDLQQARYGEIRDGHAVLIFVTEDFLTDKQVKLEDYSNGKTGSVPVLKMNMTKEFDTGIYPYTMMQSVFSPMNTLTHPHALKASATVLEWCGQSFGQLNRTDRGYRVTQHSYFEKEGDKIYPLQDAWLEDELWTRIRMAPETLPKGEIRIIPAMFASRLRHIPLEIETATATMRETDNEKVIYALRYEKSDRDLSITFNKSFPHEILSWEETYVDGWGDNAKRLTTRATRKKLIKTDYWRRNSNDDAEMRKELGLE